ncbi:MAG: tetratricopeptide repeat-containing sensor histidine kinase [Balneolaceae bacterium]|nr:tetratricopeptide repeat-containing sensor histidine kinase [Balneolaceae bacterium]
MNPRFFISFFTITVLLLQIQGIENGAISNIAVAQSQDTPIMRDTTYIRDLNQRAEDLMETGPSDSAKALIDEALTLARFLNDIEGESQAALNLAIFFIDRGTPGRVITEVLPYFESYSGTNMEIQIGNQIGTAYNMMGYYQEGLEFYIQMRDLAEERGESRMAIGLTQNIGNSYQSLGDISSALDSYLASLEMAEEIADTLLIAVILDNLASINTYEGNYEIAENYLLQALEMNIDKNNQGNQVTNYMSLGGLYRELGRFEEALESYNKVLEIADNLGNILSRMQGQYNLGLLYIEMEEYDLAMQNFRESLDLSIENNITIGSYFNQIGMGNVHRERGEYSRAVELYEAALSIAQNANAIEMIRGTLENLYETNELAGNISSAYTYLKQYSALTDSIARSDREEALARQEALLGLRMERENRELLEETIQTQRSNAIITRAALIVVALALFGIILMYRKKQQANILLRRRTEELSEVNAMKDRLLSMLAHDLRSPISSIQGVVYMIREKLLDGDDIEKALNQIDMQLQQDINTLTNYLQWAQNQRDGISANFETINLKQLAENAIFEIKKTADNKGILTKNNINADLFVIGDEHMMRVILRNLLSNAAKFVVAGDRITINAEEDGDQIKLSISDSGPGIPPERLTNIFKPFYKGSRGTSGEIGTGLGLSICKEFAEKQNGALQVDTEIGKGTTFTINLKKATMSRPVKAVAK